MNEWDKIYSQDQQLNKWPFSDVVSLVKRHMPDLRGKRVLELGSGNGNNAQFFKEERSDYIGVDAVEMHHYDKWRFETMDFTKKVPLVHDGYDLIFDRAAVTHNDTESIKRCIALVYDALKPGGLYIGVDWFSVQHTDAKLGEAVDEFTRTNIPTGQFAGVGKVHFSSFSHIVELFGNFILVDCDAKWVTKVSLPQGVVACVGTYNFVMRRPL